jgi:hypothetical protein
MALNRIIADSIADGTVIASDIADGTITLAKLQSGLLPSAAANSAAAYANAAFATANTGSASGSYANSAFASANLISGVNTTQNTNITNASTYANSAFATANTGSASGSLFVNGTSSFTGSVGITGSLAVNGTTAILGTGTINTVPKFTAANVIGNSNITDSSTLVTLGSNTYVNGLLGVGATPTVGYSVYINKNITGNAVTSYGIANTGQVQSDVTGTTYGIINQSNTQAASFTLSTYIHYGTSQGNIGAGSAITNQYGFVVGSDIVGATNNYGFYGNIPSGSNRYNLYMNGTAFNYLAGSLGIGSIGLAQYSLRVAKNITGNVFSYGINQSGIVQSDVTSAGWGYANQLYTAAASFNLTSYYHYFAQQQTIGAGSTVGNQIGFHVDSTLIGATNNYAFKGQIPSGTNRWNIHMDGTANNYLEGDTSIGTNLPATATKFTLGGSETASSAIARGQLLNTTLVASANDDTLVGLDINPTFTNGAFTGLTNLALRVQGRQLVTYSDSNFLPGLIINNTSTSTQSLASINLIVNGVTGGTVGYFPSNWSTITQRSSVIIASNGANKIGFLIERPSTNVFTNCSKSVGRHCRSSTTNLSGSES